MAAADVVAAVINYNTARLTTQCTRSLLDAGISRILVLDNASSGADYEELRTAVMPGVRIIRSDQNLGFAAGSNRIIEEALRDGACQRVLLLNSDAVASTAGLHACLDAMKSGHHDLMGARMMKPPRVGEGMVDSLGIALYKSLLASNRKSTADAYLGPTGGFAVLSRRFLEEIRALHGYVFDPTYFCYAEDTDLCVRARLLDYSVGYSDQVAAHHEGQASGTGGYDDFILYHGIRNSIWMAAKSIPFSVILTHLPWFIVLHGGIIVRHTLQRRFMTLVRLYRDAICGLPAVLRQRRVVQATRRITLEKFRSHIDRQFYETAFFNGAVRDLFRRRKA